MLPDFSLPDKIAETPPNNMRWQSDLGLGQKVNFWGNVRHKLADKISCRL